MSVSVNLVKLVVDAAVRAGADRAAIYRQAGADADALLGRARIPLDCYNQVQLAALELSGDPALGLHMGERASLAALNVVGYLFLNCRSIGEALRVFMRYHRLISDCSDSELCDADGVATIIYRFPEGPAACNRLRAEFGLCQLLRVGQQLLGRDLAPLAIGFEHPQPGYADEYQRVFRCPVRYRQAHTWLQLPSELLSAEHAHPDPNLFKLLQQQADRLLEQMSDDSLSNQIRRLISEQYGGIRPDLETMARRFHLSERSLRRRLAEEGTGYRRLADEAVCGLACARLEQPELAIAAIAAELGFSEPSAFHRAFRRWTGLTPQQYRLGHRPMGGNSGRFSQ